MLPSSALLLEQTPAPHAHLVRHAGDSLRVTLTTSQPIPGQAFVRTNLGNAALYRQEIIYHVETGIAPLGRDWRDMPMRQTGPCTYEIRLPLAEVGVFEFKCFFRENASRKTAWPRGENSRIKVISALGVAENTIYNAFVRQFGENLSGGVSYQELQDACALLDRKNYTVVPPSGTFRAVESKLDLIIHKMGFRILQFLPVHPTPTVFARMGRYGSPFAPLDFFDVDPAMAEFDRRTTPLEQFLELVDQIHGRGAMVFLDLPIDHTGWASVLQSHHPDWFVRTPDGAFQSPGAWGVVWADLCKLDFSKTELWRCLAEVFLHWCRNGIDGFRCDAGYMIPAPAWKYIVAKVRQQYPDTLFFLEGLGGGEEATTRLLDEADLDWAYSEFFQNYSHQELAHYLDYAFGYSNAHGALVNFAETHDNDRLAAKSPAWARLRVTMAALFSPAGCFGIANGVEWYAKEKIDVHGAKALNWGAAENMVDLLAFLNSLLREHPAFRATARSRVPYGAGGDAVGLLRIPFEDSPHTLLVVANPRTDAGASFQWHFQEFDAGSRPVDLLTQKPVPASLDQCIYKIVLKPGQVLCLCKPEAKALPKPPYGALERQQLRATVLRLRCSLYGTEDLRQANVEEEALQLFQNPRKFFQQLSGEKNYLPLCEWTPSKDGSREALLPDNHYLLVTSSTSFTADLSLGENIQQKCHSVPMADGRHFVFFLPFNQHANRLEQVFIHLCIHMTDGQVRRLRAPLLLLPVNTTPSVLRRITRQELTCNHTVLATNLLGGYGLLRGMWGYLHSQYDAMLAANQNPDYPVDRTVVLSRVRVWLIHHDYSQEINQNCQTDFAMTGPNTASWHFVVPTGMGGNAYLAIQYQLDSARNRCRLTFSQCPAPDEENTLPELEEDSIVTLILRPDIDDRCNHAQTLAYQGAEKLFPKRVTAYDDGFDFALSTGNRLEVRTSRGLFLNDGEWNYNEHNPQEEERGLPASHDLYSPGHFRLKLRRGESAVLEAGVLFPEEGTLDHPGEPATPLPFHEDTVKATLNDALENALDAFVVRRKPLKTVMAGYPWFLDWGRDTLICLRGLIAAGRLDDAKATIIQFASFEEDGTLPNMISGDNVSNRDTTDAPLWLFHAVSDYCHAIGRKNTPAFLAMDCRGRSLLEVLKDVVASFCKGTPNGIHVDPASMLVFSPAHFTWMDTNYPAGTPREGYPVEIQTFWFQALNFLSEVTGDSEYGQMAAKARESFLKFYPSAEHVGFSDCLHAAAGVPAAKAVPDDACRPNQLFALAVPGLVDDMALRQRVLSATGHLLVPGGMRTLAEQQVEYLLPVKKDGALLNNPRFPFWGQYIGDEDTRRKPAYHNGTAWPWLMPAFCEALLLTYGDSARYAALSLFHSTAALMRQGCLGQLPEILDGSIPHSVRGCCAQAWSVTEAYRVLKMLRK